MSLVPKDSWDLAQSRRFTCALTVPSSAPFSLLFYVSNQKPGRKCFSFVNWGPMKRQSWVY